MFCPSVSKKSVRRSLQHDNAKQNQLTSGKIARSWKQGTVKFGFEAVPWTTQLSAQRKSSPVSLRSFHSAVYDVVVFDAVEFAVEFVEGASVVWMIGASTKLIVASVSSSIFPLKGNKSSASSISAVVSPRGALIETTPPLVHDDDKLVQRSCPKVLNEGGNLTMSPAAGRRPDFQLAGSILTSVVNNCL
jgi:hypothetical protein